MQLRQHLRNFHAGWHDPIPRIVDAAENIVVTDTLDVATLPTWSRKRTLLIGDAAHATSPHAGQGASLALEDAMRLGRLMADRQELALTFQNFEAERRPRAEKIVALARRNGNSKREFSATGAWIRDRMLKLLLPLGARAWISCTRTIPARRSGRARAMGDLLLDPERQAGMVDQPLDQFVTHRGAGRPDSGRQRPAYRAAGRSRIPRSSSRSSHNRDRDRP